MDDRKYHIIHRWLDFYYKNKKIKCEICDSDKNLTFALKRGFRHEKKLRNYRILCSDCHWNYDFNLLCRDCKSRSKTIICPDCQRQKELLVKPWKAKCQECQKEHLTKFKNKRFCSVNCRVYAFYKRHNITPYNYQKKYLPQKRIGVSK